MYLNRTKIQGGFKRETMTLGEFVDNWLKRIDCNPVGQRLDTDPTGNKKIGIMESVQMGINFGELTICKTPNNPNGFEYESIDGGHRKRSVKDYTGNGGDLNRFKVFGKFYSELSDEEREEIRNYEITLVIYNELDVYTKGFIFRTLNETTDVNDQEMRNSFGDINVANVIRESVRLVPGIDNVNHELFEVTQSGNFRWLEFDNNRLKTEEMVARIVHRISIQNKDTNFLGESSQEQLVKMYQDNDKIDIDNVKKTLKEVLDFLLKCGVNHKRLYTRGLSQRDFKLLVFIYFYMKDSYTRFRIEDYEVFIKGFKKGVLTLLNPDGKYGQIINKQTWDTKGRTISEAFKGYLGAPHHKLKIQQLVFWLLSEFNVEEFITIQETKSDWSYDQKVRKLIDQNHKCYIDGTTVTFEECEAAHIQSDKYGGKRTYDNFVMVKKHYNRDMGTMNLEDYKKSLTTPV